jgi:hypothetical protein
MNRIASMLAVVWVLGSLAGCGGGLSRVSGTVTLPDGKAMSGVFVTFSDSEKQIGASGTTDENGRYQLTTSTPGDGVPPGTYQVTVTQPGPVDSSQPEGPRVFPKRYESAISSGLSFEVKPGTNTCDIKLEAQ